MKTSALSKYFSWRCSRAFGPAASEEDAHFRGFIRDHDAPDTGDDTGPDGTDAD